MKRTILAILAVIILAACVGYFRKPTPWTEEATRSTAASAQAQNDSIAEPGSSAMPGGSDSGLASAAKENAVASSPSFTTHEQRTAASAASAVSLISRAIDTVLASDSTHAQKQRAWRQLIEAGRLDDAIAALEQKRAAEPLVADYAASLGDAYIKKCSVIHDVRDQGLLAMSADKLFDTALNLDPSNWEARFTKAVAMSFWPASMNKGDEVIGHFQTLIQQQEVRPVQPEFADTYLWLGDQYQKMGQGENAIAIWTRGASLFPTHEALQNRLTAGVAGH